jgi:hypothetical protein
MENELSPKFRGIKKREFFEVIVAEGSGKDLNDPVREVHYFLDEKGEIKFTDDPCGKSLLVQDSLKEIWDNPSDERWNKCFKGGIVDKALFNVLQNVLNIKIKEIRFIQPENKMEIKFQ